MFAAVTSHNDVRALWLLQLFLAIAVLAGLVLASQVAELSRAEASLRDSERAEREARRRLPHRGGQLRLRTHIS